MNVVENTAGRKPLSVLDKDNINFSIAITTIWEELKYHPSVLNIKKTLKMFFFFWSDHNGRIEINKTH